MTTSLENASTVGEVKADIVGLLTTFGMLSQAIGTVCSNGRARAIRERLNSSRGVRPTWNDPRCQHRERELYVTAEVVKLIAPGDVQVQEALLGLNWREFHSKECDRTAIQSAPQSIKDRAFANTPTPELLPAA